MIKFETVCNKISDFIFGEHHSDALRNTLAAIIPGIVLFYGGYLEQAIAIGTGSLLSSLTDLSGNRTDKWRSALWCIPLFFMAALITVFVLDQPIWLIVWLMAAAFMSTMLNIYGARMGAVGLMTLILVTFTIGLWPSDPVAYSLHIALGVSWYYLISIVQVYISPYRSLRYALADSFRTTAVLLRAKAQCYDERIPIEDVYRELATWHVRVSEQQEMVRFLLLRENELTESESSGKGKEWLQHVLGLTDLYELLTALDHDYSAIRKTLAPLGVLSTIRRLILFLSKEVDLLSRQYTYGDHRLQSEHNIQEIKVAQQELKTNRDRSTGEEAQVLGATIRNIEYILICITKNRRIFTKPVQHNEREAPQNYVNFITLPPAGWRILQKQLNFKASVFPFALRISILFGLGGFFGLLLPEYRYAYWILLTLAIVAKPSFANTTRRNTQRILGTTSGVVLGLLLVYLIPYVGVLLILAAIFLYGFFLFNRTNYMVSVLLLTPGIIIALHIYEGNIADILGSRIVFTFIGSFLAVVGWFFIPIRQSKSITGLANNLIEKNLYYFHAVKGIIDGNAAMAEDLRLARKQAHTALAAFSDTVQQLQQEPGSKKWNWDSLHTFHSLAYRVNSLIIGLAVSATKETTDMDTKLFSARLTYLEALTADLEKLSIQLGQANKRPTVYSTS